MRNTITHKNLYSNKICASLGQNTWVSPAQMSYANTVPLQDALRKKNQQRITLKILPKKRSKENTNEWGRRLLLRGAWKAWSNVFIIWHKLVKESPLQTRDTCCDTRAEGRVVGPQRKETQPGRAQGWKSPRGRWCLLGAGSGERRSSCFLWCSLNSVI